MLNAAATRNWVDDHYLLSFHKAWSTVPYAKGDTTESIETLFLSTLHICQALIRTATLILPAHSISEETSEAKKKAYWPGAHGYRYGYDDASTVESTDFDIRVRYS